MSTARKSFTLTAVHLAMLCLLSIKWEDAPFNGGPVIDKRKPFGESSFVDTIATALGIQQLEDDKGKRHWPAGTMAKALAAFRELEQALQVALSAQSFVPGEYTCAENETQWSLLRAAPSSLS